MNEPRRSFFLASAWFGWGRGGFFFPLLLHCIRDNKIKDQYLCGVELGRWCSGWWRDSERPYNDDIPTHLLRKVQVQIRNKNLFNLICWGMGFNFLARSQKYLMARLNLSETQARLGIFSGLVSVRSLWRVPKSSKYLIIFRYGNRIHESPLFGWCVWSRVIWINERRKEAQTVDLTGCYCLHWLCDIQDRRLTCRRQDTTIHMQSGGGCGCLMGY